MRVGEAGRLSNGVWDVKVWVAEFFFPTLPQSILAAGERRQTTHGMLDVERDANTRWSRWYAGSV